MNRNPHRAKSAKTCFKPKIHDLSLHTVHPNINRATDDEDDALINIMKMVNSTKYTNDALDRPDSAYTNRSIPLTSPIPSPRDACKAACSLPLYQPDFQQTNIIQKRQVQKSGRHRSRICRSALRSTYNVQIPYITPSLQDLCLIPTEESKDYYQPRCGTPYRYSSEEKRRIPSASRRYFDTNNGVCLSSPRLPSASITRRPFTANSNMPSIKIQKIKLHAKINWYVDDE